MAKKSDKTEQPEYPSLKEIKDLMLQTMVLHKIGMVTGDELFIQAHNLLGVLAGRLATDNDLNGLDVMIRTMSMVIGAVCSGPKTRDEFNDKIKEFAQEEIKRIDAEIAKRGKAQNN